AVDAKGDPTTDPHLARAGVPLGGPIYGYKGYGLAFMIDLLCGVMNGMTYGRHINSMYEELDQPRKIGHLVMAIDPGRFAGAARLAVMEETYITHKLWLAADRDALLASLADRIDAVATSGTKGLDDATMGKLPKLKMISHFGVGVDSIDTEAVKRRGIMLWNTP